MGLCYNVKVCLLGDSSVGKSSLALRFVENTFDTNVPSTIGAAFLKRTVVLHKDEDIITYKLQIWDTAGQERYQSIAPLYYRGASIVLVLYDVSNAITLKRGVQKWIEELKSHGPSNAVVVLVGNKSDIDKNLRKVNSEEGLKLSRRYGALFFETSAKSGQNVNAVFTEACKRLNVKHLLPSVFNDDNNSDNRNFEIKIKTNKMKKLSPFRLGQAKSAETSDQKHCCKNL